MSKIQNYFNGPKEKVVGNKPITVAEKVVALNSEVLDFAKLIPADKDDVLVNTELADVNAAETGVGTGIFSGSVGGNGFVVTPLGDTALSDLISIEVTYTSIGGNTTVDTINAQKVKIGNSYSFISKVMGKWTVKVTNASKKISSVSLRGL